MKTLALFMILANIVLFLWEYHSGAFLPDREETQHSVANDLEPILLASEVQQRLENQALWQAKAVREKVPFVSDYFQEQIVQGKIEADAYRFLPVGPVTLPWSELIAAQVKIMQKTAPQAPSKKLIQIAASGGDTQILAKADEPTSAPEQPSATVTTIQTDPDSTQDNPVESDSTGVVEPAAPLNTAEQMLCYEAGPFANIELLKQWRSRSGIDSTLVTSLQREEQEVTGYLVYYPAPATFEQAKANAEMLKKKGITDLWLFRKGESKGEISLGLFRNKRRAEVLEQQLMAKGLEVMIRPRYKEATRFYAQVSIAEQNEDKLFVSRDLWQKQDPEFTIQAGTGCVPSSNEPEQ
ncbi:MAG: hypothetical protein ACU85E_05520 [Gammaproteobacteria bacterium]